MVAVETNSPQHFWQSQNLVTNITCLQIGSSVNRAISSLLWTPVYEVYRLLEIRKENMTFHTQFILPYLGIFFYSIIQI